MEKAGEAHVGLGLDLCRGLSEATPRIRFQTDSDDILAHHGEYEYGSPKKPAIMEAMALNLADNADAKLETFTEILEGTTEQGWLGYNRLFESNLRGTRME